jgi:hypothetical protein
MQGKFKTLLHRGGSSREQKQISLALSYGNQVFTGREVEQEWSLKAMLSKPIY